MSRQLAEFHNKALRLDPDDVRAPFPAAFWVHEQIAWGKNFHVGPIQISGSLPQEVPVRHTAVGMAIAMTPEDEQPARRSHNHHNAGLTGSSLQLQSSIPSPPRHPTELPEPTRL